MKTGKSPILEELEMKKFITIMAIMIVLVGTIFAANDASLTITLTISEVLPKFKLATSDETYIASAVSDLVETSGSTGGDNSGAAKATATAAAGKRLADGNSLTVRFGILQVNNAQGYIKTTKAYTFTASASDLVNTSNDSYKFEASDSITFTSTGYIDAAYGSVEGGSSLAVTYTGASYTPASTEAEIGTFDVTWNANTAAINGEYSATVTLIMTTT